MTVVKELCVKETPDRIKKNWFGLKAEELAEELGEALVRMILGHWGK